jgi:hypothetical protein
MCEDLHPYPYTQSRNSVVFCPLALYWYYSDCHSYIKICFWDQKSLYQMCNVGIHIVLAKDLVFLNEFAAINYAELQGRMLGFIKTNL